MGTSKPYKWPHKCHINKRFENFATREASPRELSEAIVDSANKVCNAIGRERWRDDIYQPITAMATDTTAQLSLSLREIITGDRDWPEDPYALGDFVSHVCGQEDGMHAAPIRRAVVSTVQQSTFEVQARIANGKSAVDARLFCVIYNLFHTELMKELLLHFLTETALPGVSSLILSTELGQWATERVAKLLPNPCKGVADKGSLAVATRGAQLAERAFDSLVTGRVYEEETPI